GLTAAAPDVVVAARVTVRADPREVGDVVIRLRHVLAEEDVRGPRSGDELDADLLELGLDDGLLRGPRRVVRGPGVLELRRIASAREDRAVVRGRSRGAARATVLLQQRQGLRLAVVEDLERALVLRLRRVVDRAVQRLRVAGQRTVDRVDQRLAV